MGVAGFLERYRFRRAMLARPMVWEHVRTARWNLDPSFVSEQEIDFCAVVDGHRLLAGYRPWASLNGPYHELWREDATGNWVCCGTFYRWPSAWVTSLKGVAC